MDFSEIVITQMQKKHPELDWQVEDVRKLTLGDSSIDIAIEKVRLKNSDLWVGF